LKRSESGRKTWPEAGFAGREAMLALCDLVARRRGLVGEAWFPPRVIVALPDNDGREVRKTSGTLA
jgi:hypothetical protein